MGARNYSPRNTAQGTILDGLPATRKVFSNSVRELSIEILDVLRPRDCARQTYRGRGLLQNECLQ
jgi:hypothetical protein